MARARQAALDLVDQLGLEQRALRRVVIERRACRRRWRSCAAPARHATARSGSKSGASGSTCMPRLRNTPSAASQSARIPASSGIVAVPVADPADALRRASGLFERRRETRDVPAGHAGRRASGPASMSSSSARSRTVRAMGPSVEIWLQEEIADRVARDAAEARPETVDVAEGGRVAQRPHRVGAVGDAARSRAASAAAAPPLDPPAVRDRS